MEKEKNISFNNAIIETLFPFYFVFDKTLQITEAGKSIKKIVPTIIGSTLNNLFTIKRPHFFVSNNFESLVETVNQVIILQTNNQPEILLRGQLICLSNKEIVFVGSPWITSANDFTVYNLNIPDFAIHDSITDMLQVLQTKDIISQDIDKLINELTKQKIELEKSEDELKKSNQRLSAVIRNIQSSILLENEERKIVLVNNYFCELFSIPVPPEHLIGFDCANAAEDSKKLFKDPDAFVARIAEIIRDKKLVQNEEIIMADNAIVERDFIPIWADEKYYGHMWVYRDITKRKKNEEELVNAKEKAISAKRNKEEFIANVSHELRNPINIINGLTALTLETNLNPTQKEYLEIIKNSTENLMMLVNDILDFEKIEAKKIKIQNKIFNIRTCLEEVVKSLKYQAENKEVSLRLDLVENIPDYIIGDDLRLQQILTNLINNSIKFTQKGNITINVNHRNKTNTTAEFIFKISDTGIGISKKELESIFERYTQISGEKTMNENGIGLGLTIVKNLVELQQGHIQVKSEINKGTTFIVHIPYELAIADAIKPSIVEKSFISLNDINILLAEDNITNQLIVKKMIEKHNGRIETAENGQIAADIIQKKKFDVILMDIHMPILNGFEVTATMRNDANNINHLTPVIAVTANALSGDKERCLASGMNGYITKPFKEEDLIEIINAMKTTSHTVESTIDLSYLQSLDPGNKAFEEKIIRQLLDEAPVVLNEIELAFNENDIANAAKKIHKLKGSMALVLSEKYKTEYSEIEKQIRIPAKKIDRALFKSLQNICNSTFTELRNYV